MQSQGELSGLAKDDAGDVFLEGLIESIRDEFALSMRASQERSVQGVAEAL